jgi:hypothetical protein
LLTGSPRADAWVPSVRKQQNQLKIQIADVADDCKQGGRISGERFRPKRTFGGDVGHLHAASTVAKKTGATNEAYSWYMCAALLRPESQGAQRRLANDGTGWMAKRWGKVRSLP